MADPNNPLEIHYWAGEANFTLSTHAVPATSIEDFSPTKDSEARDIVETTIQAVQNRKRIELLEQQLALEVPTDPSSVEALEQQFGLELLPTDTTIKEDKEI